MTIESENGHRYELSVEAVRRLQLAKNGRDAEYVYNGFASHVDKADRAGIWFACDDYDV